MKKTIIGYLRSVDVSSNQLERQQEQLERDMLRDGVDLSTVEWVTEITAAYRKSLPTPFLNHITADTKAVYVNDITRISRNGEYLRKVISYLRENDIKLYAAGGLVDLKFFGLYINFLEEGKL